MQSHSSNQFSEGLNFGRNVDLSNIYMQIIRDTYLINQNIVIFVSLIQDDKSINIIDYESSFSWILQH